MRTRRSALMVGALMVGALITTAPGANAAFPGANGRIAFATNKNGADYEIYTMNPNGTGLVRLTDNIADDYSPSFSANGTRITFVRYHDGKGDIWTMKSDGTNKTQLTSSSANDDSPSFSPGGAKIAFTRSFGDAGREIMVMNDTGSGVTRLTNNTTDDTDPVFSPDGTKIAYDCKFAASFHICIVNSDGTGMTTLPGTDDGSDSFAPDWSPDGTSIVFVRFPAGSKQSAVNTQAIAGGPPVVLTPLSGHVNYAHYSPDGTKIAYDSGYPSEIFTMNVDGSNKTNITNSVTFDDWGSDWQAT